MDGMRGTRVGAGGPDARGGARALLAALALLALAFAGSAHAGVLYRCTGASGELAYVSRTAGYTNCARIGQWEEASVRRNAGGRKAARRDENTSGAKALPGPPPRAVTANPAVLKVIPLEESDSIEVRKLSGPQAWRPLPVTVLDVLGKTLLPRVLGIAAPPPAPPTQAAVAPADVPAARAIPLTLAAAGRPPPPATGAVYRVVQPDGRVLYTNIPALAHGQDVKRLFVYIAECYACGLHSKVDWDHVPLHLAEYGEDIGAAARASGVSAALLRAVIHAESGFNSRALSIKGAQGLMQLMPGTATDMGVADAFNPAQNIAGGARYLARLLRDYHGDVKLAAAAYNAGAGALARHGGSVPPYAETQVYVQRVALLYQRYQKALAGATLASATLR